MEIFIAQGFPEPGAPDPWWRFVAEPHAVDRVHGAPLVEPVVVGRTTVPGARLTRPGTRKNRTALIRGRPSCARGLLQCAHA